MAAPQRQPSHERWKQNWKTQSDNRALLSESATFVLVSTFGRDGYRSRVLSRIEQRMADIATLLAHVEATQAYESPPGRLFRAALRDETENNMDAIFWLIGALSSREEAQVIERSLYGLNEQTRANGAEALKSVTTAQIARELLPFCTPGVQQTVQAHRAHAVESLEAEQVLHYAWPELDCGLTSPPLSNDLVLFYGDDWLRAAAIHATPTSRPRGPGLSDCGTRPHPTAVDPDHGFSPESDWPRPQKGRAYSLEPSAFCLERQDKAC